MWRKYNPIKRAPILKQGLIERATPVELILKEALEEKGIVFEFQKPIIFKTRCFIVDFHIPCNRGELIIELDGAGHFKKNKIRYDKLRTKLLNTKGYKVIRYPNVEIYSRLVFIINEILEHEPIVVEIPKFYGLLK